MILKLLRVSTSIYAQMSRGEHTVSWNVSFRVTWRFFFVWRKAENKFTFKKNGNYFVIFFLNWTCMYREFEKYFSFVSKLTYKTNNQFLLLGHRVAVYHPQPLCLKGLVIISLHLFWYFLSKQSLEANVSEWRIFLNI